MPKILSRKKFHRKSGFVKLAKKSVNVVPSSSVEQELAFSRALSALCGGSGVGQSPEPPLSAESWDAGSIKADRISLQARGFGSINPPPPPPPAAGGNFFFF